LFEKLYSPECANANRYVGNSEHVQTFYIHDLARRVNILEDLRNEDIVFLVDSAAFSSNRARIRMLLVSGNPKARAEQRFDLRV
jgi:hypothetical protein